MERTIKEAQYGCIVFDSTHKHEQGWAAISGKKAYRIPNTRQLKSDVIWLHNLDYEMTFAAGMENHAGLRRNDYLSEDFIKHRDSKKIAAGDAGTPCDIARSLDANPKEGSQQAMRMAAFFERVMTVTDHFGIDGAPAGALHWGVRELMFSYDSILPKHIVDAVVGATATYVTTERDPNPTGEDGTRMTLLMPRVDHGVHCSNVLLPAGEWREVALPLGNEGAIDDWILSVGVYSLVEFTIKNVSEEAYRLLNFGSGRKTRRWVTGFELLLINKFADVTLKKAYVPSDIIAIDALQSMLEQHDPIHELSLAMGIFWQNIWTGLGYKRQPPPHIKKQQLAINPLTPFIRAIDRNACLMAAMILQGKGITISGYGKGKVHILHDGDNDRLAEACRSAKVIPPFLKTKDREDLGLTPISMFQEIYIQGDYEQLDSADKQIVAMLTSAHVVDDGESKPASAPNRLHTKQIDATNESSDEN